ncbi:MAG: HAD family hydrolase [Clostridiales bacterium]|jgi:phosphoglycolate phosphatase|nr:HAD family hydrolase [Eubacteriales bacterium]MDH7566348.1 HAD family hydrolase [Clostridiales bacterium]
MFNAVIFDLDGTLLNTIQDLANSMNAVLSHFGFPTHSVQKYKYLVGMGMANLVRSALPEGSFNESGLPRYIEMFREEYGKRWDEAARPYEGIPELLDELAGRGLKMAVLSNKPDNFTQLIITKLLPSWKFDAVYGERPSVPRKPDPAGALEISRLLGIPPVEFLYLGDSGTDMDTANAAGMYAVGALWGFRDRAELVAHGAKAVIEKPEDLLKFL